MKLLSFLAIGTLFLVQLYSCKKEESRAFWTANKKFEFQHYSYVYRSGNTIEIIRLGDYDASQPQQANIELYTGYIGGQLSFSNSTATDNFIYIENIQNSIGTYTTNSINLNTGIIIVNVGGSIKEVGADQVFDTRAINSLTYNGKVYYPNTYNYQVARADQPGAPISRMISYGKNCFFMGCVNGTEEQIEWNLDLDHNKIAITTGKLNITGSIISPPFATPIIETTDGKRYIIQFYSYYDQACRCSMQFKLYNIDQHKNSHVDGKFSLVIGDC